jgi:hypothetical protein
MNGPSLVNTDQDRAERRIVRLSRDVDAGACDWLCAPPRGVVPVPSFVLPGARMHVSTPRIVGAPPCALDEQATCARLRGAARVSMRGEPRATVSELRVSSRVDRLGTHRRSCASFVALHSQADGRA